MMRLLGLAVLCIALMIGGGCGNYDEVSVTRQLISAGNSVEDVDSLEVWYIGNLQNHSPIRVQAYYVEPKGDSPPLTSATYTQYVQFIDGVVKEAQTFFANEMDRHGYGHQTFKAFTNTDGETAVRRLTLPHTVEDYNEGRFPLLRDDLIATENLSNSQRCINVYFINIPLYLGCGYGWGHATEGSVYLFSESQCWNWEVFAHELGHAVGLHHDFRDDAFIMSYGEHRTELSSGAAGWLHRHRAFNYNDGAFNHTWGLSFNSIQILDVDNLRFECRVNDSPYAYEDYRNFILTFDYAVLVNTEYRTVIAYTDTIINRFEETQQLLDGGPKTLYERVFTLSFEGTLPTNVSNVKIVFIGINGQILGPSQTVEIPH